MWSHFFHPPPLSVYTFPVSGLSAFISPQNEQCILIKCSSHRKEMFWMKGFTSTQTGWETQPRGWACTMCWVQLRPRRKSSPLLLKSLFCGLGHRKWGPLSTAVQHQAAACDRKDLSLQPHTVIISGLFTFPLSHFSQADSEPALLSTPLWWLLTHSTYLWPMWYVGCRLECARA